MKSPETLQTKDLAVYSLNISIHVYFICSVLYSIISFNLMTNYVFQVSLSELLIYYMCIKNPKVFKGSLPYLCSKLLFTGTLLIKTVLFFRIADQISDNVFLLSNISILCFMLILHYNWREIVRYSVVPINILFEAKEKGIFLVLLYQVQNLIGNAGC